VSVSFSAVHEHDTHELLRTSTRGCHEDATRKTASVEFKLKRAPKQRSSQIIMASRYIAVAIVGPLHCIVSIYCYTCHGGQYFQLSIMAHFHYRLLYLYNISGLSANLPNFFHTLSVSYAAHNVVSSLV